MSAADVEPGLQAVLDQINAMGAPGPEAGTPDEARAAYAALGAMDGPAEDVDAAVDEVIAGVPVRRYAPAGGDAVGTLVWFHGGGWVIGSVADSDGTARKLANRGGCTVVSVDYRLAPEHPYPAAIDDCWAVTEALAAAGEGPLAVGGDSAGGNLAAAVALRARDAGLDLRHQLLVYPVTEAAEEHPSYAENGEGKLLTASTMRWFRQCYVGAGGATDVDASPLRADVAGVAPAHVLTAGHDPLRDEGEAYVAKLTAAGVPVVHDPYPTMIHGFIGLGLLTPTAAEALTHAGALLKQHLRA